MDNKNDENDEMKALMESLEAEADDEEFCERCDVGIVAQRFGLQLCSEGCSPFEDAPLDTRVLVRVSSDDHKRWKYCAAVGRHSISAMIRREVNGYVASPVPGFESWEMSKSEQARRAQTIEVRVSAAERDLWARAAQEDGRSLSGMILRAVQRHVWRIMDALEGMGG